MTVGPGAGPGQTAVSIITTGGLAQLWVDGKLVWTEELGLSSIDLKPVMLSQDYNSAEAVNEHTTTLGPIARLRRQLKHRARLTAFNKVEGGSTLAIAGSTVYETVYGIELENGNLTTKWRALLPRAEGYQLVKLLQAGTITLAGPRSAKVGAVVYIVQSDQRMRQTKVFLFELSTGNPVSHSDLELIELAGEPLAVSFVDSDSLVIVDGNRRTHSFGSAGAGPAAELSWLEHDTNRVLSFNSHNPLAARVEPSWAIELRRGWSVVEIVGSSPLEAVASIGRVLGDRTSLLKYLNPNLIVVTTQSEVYRSSHELLLVDGSTGQTLDQVQLDAVEPGTISVLIRDNWIIITHSTHNTLANPTRIVSIELYQSPSGLTLLSRSFISPLALKIKAITRTRSGITQLNGLCKNLIDCCVLITD